MVDISTVGYDVELLTETGARYLLNGELQSLQWEEQKNELAQRASVTLANAQIGGQKIIALAKLNCVIMIYGKWGSTRQLVFEGVIWEWPYTESVSKDLKLTVYDRAKYLMQSEDFRYYSAGMTTSDIVGDICREWGVPLSYTWRQSVTHEKKVFNRRHLSDMIIELLDEAARKTGGRYVILFRDGRLHITGRGMNIAVYRFDGTNTETTVNKLSMNELVTRVKVIGKQDNDGRAPVEAVRDGDTRFGVLQRIVQRDTNTTLGAAIAEADTVIREGGKPKETNQITIPDLPFLRKGDKVELAAGNLKGIFYVEGVSHNADIGKMTLTVERA